MNERANPISRRKEVFNMPPIGGSSRVVIPKRFLEMFLKEPRFVLDPAPGLWPVDIRILREGMLEKLMADKQFAANFDVMVVPKAGR